MNKITEVSSDYRQRHLVPVEGSDVRAELTLEFKPLHNCWVFSLVWGDFATYNETVVCATNLLRQYMKLLPFGFLVITKSNLDPMTVDAFDTGEADFLIITSAEAEEIETLLYG